MELRIGVNPIIWTNDDVPELGGEIPLLTCLAQAQEAGYAGIELGGKFPRQAALLKPILDEHHLALVSGWFDGKLLENDVAAEFDLILPHLTLLRDLGAECVVYADCSRGRQGGIHDPISTRPRLAEEEWEDYGRRLTRLAENFAEFGVPMAFHHHMGTFVETDAEIDRLLSVTGAAVGLLLDTGHCAFSGGDPHTVLNRHARRVRHVHCKDVRADILRKARAEDMSFMAAVMEGIFTVPGDGALDFPAIFETLSSAGYSGWLVVEAEQDPTKADPLTYAKLGHANVRKSLKEAGR